MTTEDVIKATAWGDVTLLGLSWEGGRDVVLRVMLPGPAAEADRERLVVLRWAADVSVNLKGRGGPPLTWDASFQRTADGRWAALFDFAHAGEIRLSCEDVEVVNIPR